MLVSSYCCASYGAANTFSSLGPFSISFIGDLMLSPMDGCEHPLLYLSVTGRASQETTISSSCQPALVGIHNSVWFWWLFMEWILRWGTHWMVFPSVSDLHFVSVTPSMGILFPILRRNKVSTHCKEPRCPSTEEWIQKMWYIYTMEYYLAIKINEFTKFSSNCWN